MGLIGFAATESGRLRIKYHVSSSKKNHSAEQKRSPQNKGMKNPHCGLGRIKVMFLMLILINMLGFLTAMDK